MQVCSDMMKNNCEVLQISRSDKLVFVSAWKKLTNWPTKHVKKMADAPQDFEPPATPAASPPRIDESERPEILYDEPMTPWVPGLQDEESEDNIQPSNQG